MKYPLMALQQKKKTCLRPRLHDHHTIGCLVWIAEIDVGIHFAAYTNHVSAAINAHTCFSISKFMKSINFTRTRYYPLEVFDIERPRIVPNFRCSCHLHSNSVASEVSSVLRLELGLVFALLPRLYDDKMIGCLISMSRNKCWDPLCSLNF